MGPYCKFCDWRCFLDRVIPGGPLKGRSFILATCPQGMALDLETTGYTHETALNPVTQAEAVEALAAEMRGETVPVDPEMLGPVEKIRHAEGLIRAEHRVLGDDWLFWGKVADHLNDIAHVPEKAGQRESDWRAFNRAQDMATGYIRMSAVGRTANH
jgi:hypothetical protein